MDAELASSRRVLNEIRFFAAVLWQGIRDFFAVNGLFLSAGLAFYVLVYCFPLLFLFVSAVGYALRSDRAMSALERLIGQLMPTSGLVGSTSLDTLVHQREILGLVGVVTFLAFGTFLFDAVRHVLNTVFHVTQERPIWKAFGADFLVMLAMGVLLGLTIVVTSALEIAGEYGAQVRWIGAFFDSGWLLVGRGVGFALAMAMLYLLYRVAPAKTLSSRALMFTAFVGSCLFEVSKILFAWYVSVVGDTAVFYGALSGLIFLVLWIYYASAVFTLAASLGRAYELARRPLP